MLSDFADKIDKPILKNKEATQRIYDNSVDKTTGILYLVQGVADAYKGHLKYGCIEFNVKNK